MQKFKFLVAYGLKKRLLKKSFIITNVILGLVIIAVINLPSIIDFFASDEEPQALVVQVDNLTDDQTYPLEEMLVQILSASYYGDQFELAEEPIAASDAFFEQRDVDLLLVFEGSLAQPDVKIYALDQSLVSLVMNQVQVLLNDYQNINYANYDIVSPPSSGDENGLAEEDRLFINSIVSVLFLPVFILIIMATQFLGVDIIEEKSSKAIETVIASVPAKVHFLSKIIANLGFLVIQAGILIVFSLIGSFASGMFEQLSNTEELSLLAEFASRIQNWPSLLALSILFMLAGTLLYLTLAALIASIATTQEDYQQFQAPLVFLLLGGFYIGIFLPMAGVDGAVRVFAYIPFFSTIVAPIAYATGVINLVEAIIALVGLVVMAVIFLYLVAPIYRVAILSYEETNFFKRIKLYGKKAFSKDKKLKN